MERENMVTITDLKKSYGRFEVLRGLNMYVHDGDIYGFLGRNGCGKTTTMNIICDIIPKDSGNIVIGSGGEKRTKIGYLPESPTIFGYMTAREYLEYIGACCEYDGDIPKRASEVLNIVGLTQAADRRTKGFSRGMTQRLGMGAAIFRKPELLIFDEPTSALDPQGRSEVIDIINRLKSLGSTIILSTHILSDVEKVANRIGIVSDGKLAEEGELTEILRRHGGDVVKLSIRGLSQENKIALLKVDFARAEYDEVTNTFRFGTENAEETVKRLTKIISENDMIIEKMEIGTATLDEVFRKVSG